MQTIYIRGLTEKQQRLLEQEGYVVFLDKHKRASIPLTITKKIGTYLRRIAEVLEDTNFEER